MVVTLCSVVIWGVIQLKWMSDRREFLKIYHPWIANMEIRAAAPGLLWLFGEEGIAEMWLSETDEVQDQARRLFPEARVEPRLPGHRDWQDRRFLK